MCVCGGRFLGEAGCYASCSTWDSPAAARSAHGRGSAAALTGRSTPSALSRERQVVEACFRSPVGSCRVTLCVDRGQVARLTRERAVSKEQRAGHLTNAHLAGDSEERPPDVWLRRLLAACSPSQTTRFYPKLPS